MAAAVAVGAAIYPLSSASAAGSTTHTSTTGRSAHVMTSAADASVPALTKTVTSSASASRRIDSVPVSTHTSTITSTKTTLHAATANTGTTLYVTLKNAACAAGTGTGTQANPYCSLQAAVNAATAGTTIDVSGSSSSAYTTPVTVTTSNISIVGVGTGVLMDMSANVGTSVLTLNGVTGVTVSNMGFTAPKFASVSANSGVSIVGSSGVTLSSDDISALNIDGASSGIAVTRSFFGMLNAIDFPGVTISSGASAITIAGDVFAGGEIQATGVSGLNVTNNTIQRGCPSAIDIEGTSTSVYLENNLIENGNDVTGTVGGGGSTANVVDCTGPSNAFEPDVVVAAGSTAGVTTDYNEFYTVAGYPAAPFPTVFYAWNGTNYSAVSSFHTAVPSEAAHDIHDDSVGASLAFVMPGVQEYVNGPLIWGSPAIGSADTNAPGALSSDFYGVSPFNSRGALQYVSPDPQLAIGVTADVSAMGVALTLQLTSVSGITLKTTASWGDGTSTSVQMLAGGNTQFPRHAYTALGTYPITVTVTDNAGDTATNSVTVQTLGSDYTAFGPVRILDTRDGTGTNGSTAKLTSAAPLLMHVVGVKGIPSDVTAVALNLTLADPTGFGNVKAYPDGVTTVPTVSNLNYAVGQTVANAAIVPVGANGAIDLAKEGPGGVDMIADVTGYFTMANANGYKALSPIRALDTRYGIGGVHTPLTSTAPITLTVTGGQVPAGISAVSVNVTLTDSQGFGNVAVFPAGEAAPGTSTINYSGNHLTIANAAIVPVDSQGRIELAKQGPGSANMIVDVEGYFSTTAGASAYVPVVPTRIVDTRTVSNGKLPALWYYDFLMNPDNEPGITGFAFNSTVTNVNAIGFLTVFPDNGDGDNGGATAPTASNLNFTDNATVPNLTLAAIAPNGYIDFYNGSTTSSLDLIVDAFGYFGNA